MRYKIGNVVKLEASNTPYFVLDVHKSPSAENYQYLLSTNPKISNGSKILVKKEMEIVGKLNLVNYYFPVLSSPRMRTPQSTVRRIM